MSSTMTMGDDGSSGVRHRDCCRRRFFDVSVSISDSFCGGNIELLAPPSIEYMEWKEKGGEGEGTKGCSFATTSAADTATETATAAATATATAAASAESAVAATATVRLAIKPDPFTKSERATHMQYFAFRSDVSFVLAEEGKREQEYADADADAKEATVVQVRYVIENAGDASFPMAWTGTTACYNDGGGDRGGGDEGSLLSPGAEVDDLDDDAWRRNLTTSYRSDIGELSWVHVHRLIALNAARTRNGGNNGFDNGGGGEVQQQQEETRRCRCSRVYFAYFPPYTYRRHRSLIAECERASASSKHAATVRTLGRTLQGRPIDCVTVGTGPSVAWIIHRQHPGETQAEFYAEGLLRRLLNLGPVTTTTTTPADRGERRDDDKAGEIETSDAVRDEILKHYTLHIVPCVCIDGAVMGHLRTNSAGSNLNREWSTHQVATTPLVSGTGGDGSGDDTYVAPSLERSPEIHCILADMDRTKVDVFLDIHGDEELPYVFLSGSEQTPNWIAPTNFPRLRNLHGAFAYRYRRVNAHMQSVVGYVPPANPNMALKRLHMATRQIATRFDCLAVTLEMPYKDCWSDEAHPDPERGWTPSKCMRLGWDVLEPLAYVRPFLRTKKKKQEEDGNDGGGGDIDGHAVPEFGPEEQYIKPRDDFVAYELERSIRKADDATLKAYLDAYGLS